MVKAAPLWRAPPLELSAVATALLMVACAHFAHVAPVASGDLLLFNNETQSLETRDQSGNMTSNTVPLRAGGGIDTVLPGAASGNARFFFNPATDGAGHPKIVVTNNGGAQPLVEASVVVPQPPGHTGCDFDTSGRIGLGGPFIAAGLPTLASGGLYPLAVLFVCPNVVCRDTYLVTYTYDPTTKRLSYKTRTHLQTLPSLANFGGGPGPVCTEASTDFGGGIYAPQNIMYAAGNRTSPPYLIATQQNGSSPNSFGSAALFRLDGSNLTQVAPADGEFSDVNSASCNNFVWLRNDTSPAAAAPPITLAASCALNGPGAHTAIHASEGLANGNDFDQVNATGHRIYAATTAPLNNGRIMHQFGYLIFAIPQDGIAATSAAPVNSSVISVALMPGQPLQATILFALPTPTYTGIVFVP